MSRRTNILSPFVLSAGAPVAVKAVVSAGGAGAAAGAADAAGGSAGTGGARPLRTSSSHGALRGGPTQHGEDRGELVCVRPR